MRANLCCTLDMGCPKTLDVQIIMSIAIQNVYKLFFSQVKSLYQIHVHFRQTWLLIWYFMFKSENLRWGYQCVKLDIVVLQPKGIQRLQSSNNPECYLQLIVYLSDFSLQKGDIYFSLISYKSFSVILI